MRMPTVELWLSELKWTKRRPRVQKILKELYLWILFERNVLGIIFSWETWNVLVTRSEKTMILTKLFSRLDGKGEGVRVRSRLGWNFLLLRSNYTHRRFPALYCKSDNRSRLSRSPSLGQPKNVNYQFLRFLFDFFFSLLHLLLFMTWKRVWAVCRAY